MSTQQTISITAEVQLNDLSAFPWVEHPKLSYDAGSGDLELTSTKIITIGGVHLVGYVARCIPSKGEWICFGRDGTLWSGMGRTRAEAVRLFILYR